MKLIHFSDTHLGFSEYTRIDPETGINQREQDFYNAWEQVIRDILRKKPDAVVHSGDLFHTSRPSNRAIRTALEGIQKISRAGIPLVMVSGNHSTPRIRSTGSIFESISLFENVHAAYRGEYERFRIGDAEFHCIPHCSLSEDLEKAFASVELTAAPYQVLVTHGAWSGRQVFSMGEFNEQILSDPAAAYGLNFDYIALGHYHRRLDVAENAAYPGSTERTSFNEAGYRSGYILVDLQSGERRDFFIDSRPMIKPPPLDCGEFSLGDIYRELEQISRDIPEGALLSLSLVNIAADVFLKIDMREIESLFPQVFYLEKKFSRREAGESASLSTHIGSLEVEFEKYMQAVETADETRQQLVQLGREYLQK